MWCILEMRPYLIRPSLLVSYRECQHAILTVRRVKTNINIGAGRDPAILIAVDLHLPRPVPSA
jgi:hypothetical protein